MPEPAGLLIPATAARLQLNVVPAVTLVGVYENKVLLHIAGGVSELDKVGEGFTVTIVFADVEQEFTSVTVKEYVPAAAGVAFAMTGFCKLEMNPFGPVQLYDNEPVPPDAVVKRFNAEPSQMGLFE